MVFLLFCSTLYTSGVHVSVRVEVRAAAGRRRITALRELRRQRAEPRRRKNWNQFFKARGAERRDKHLPPFNPPGRLIPGRSVIATGRSESPPAGELKLMIGLIRRSCILMRRSVMKPLALDGSIDRVEERGQRRRARSPRRLVIRSQ